MIWDYFIEIYAVAMLLLSWHLLWRRHQHYRRQSMLVIKTIRETREYIIVGTAGDNSKYWDKDFKEAARFPLKKAEVLTTEQIREPTVSEKAMYEAYIYKDRD